MRPGERGLVSSRNLLGSSGEGEEAGRSRAAGARRGERLGQAASRKTPVPLYLVMAAHRRVVLPLLALLALVATVYGGKWALAESLSRHFSAPLSYLSPHPHGR